MIRGRARVKVVVPDQLIDEEYSYQRERHKNGRCHMGDWGWAWIPGTLFVKCKLCDYRMKINPKTKKLEHLESKRKAVKDCGAIRTYSPS